MNDTIEVAIRTTSQGPFVDDVFWLFVKRDGSVLEVPSQHVDVAQLQAELPGLDNMKIIDAMTCTRDRIFRVWHPDEPAYDVSALEQRFRKLVGAHYDPAIFAELRKAWTRPGYHNLEHLNDCLRELDTAPKNAIAELALWYHDAIYVPGAKDNELRSAELLREHARAMNLNNVDAAVACVLATADHASATPETALVVDIDLAILGRSLLRVADYNDAIAEEYAGTMFYGLGRKRFLKKLLDQPKIFHTPLFAERYEEKARANLRALLRTSI